MAAPKMRHLLLIEDDPGDRLLIQKSLPQGHSLVIHAVGDGEDALAFLRRQGTYSASPIPDLILLDLNLPKIGGHEILAEVRRDPKLTHLPVMVLTTSTAESDVLACYQLHANAFVSKPMDMGRLREVLQSVENFWFNVVTLPTKPS